MEAQAKRIPRIFVKVHEDGRDQIRIIDLPLEAGLEELLKRVAETYGYVPPSIQRLMDDLRAKRFADAAGSAMFGFLLFASGIIGLALALALISKLVGPI